MKKIFIFLFVALIAVPNLYAQKYGTGGSWEVGDTLFVTRIKPQSGTVVYIDTIICDSLNLRAITYGNQIDSTKVIALIHDSLAAKFPLDTTLLTKLSWNLYIKNVIKDTVTTNWVNSDSGNFRKLYADSVNGGGIEGDTLTANFIKARDSVNTKDIGISARLTARSGVVDTLTINTVLNEPIVATLPFQNIVLYSKCDTPDTLINNLVGGTNYEFTDSASGVVIDSQLIGTSLHFGAPSILEAPYNRDLVAGTEDWTFACFFKSDTTDSTGYIYTTFNDPSGAYTAGWYVYLGSDGKVYVTFDDAFLAQGPNLSTTGTSYDDGNPHFVGIVCDSTGTTTAAVTVYIDNETLTGTISGARTGFYAGAGTSAISVGVNTQTSVRNYFYGSIDGITYIRNSALNAQQMDALKRGLIASMFQ